MTQAEVNSAYEEVAPHQAEHESPSEPNYQQEIERHREVDQDRNWKQARERIAALEAESKRKDELLEKALSFSQSAKPTTPVVQEEEEEPDDEYINKAGVKKVAKKILDPIEKEIQELKNELNRRRQNELFDNLRKTYPDFENVVNDSTIKLFEKKEPELANIIAEIKDPIKMGLQAYKYIKALNLMQDVPEDRHQQESVKMMEKNQKSIQSPQAYDKRPMAQAFNLATLSNEQKSALWEEMNHFGSQFSSVPPMH